MSKRSVKTALKPFLEAIDGITTVYEGMPSDIPGAALPAVVIFLPEDEDARVAGMAGVGRRKETTRALLRLFDLDATPDAVAGSLAFDDLVDGVKNVIRTNPQFAGTEFPVAGVNYVRSKVAEAKEAGKQNGKVFRMAEIEFDIVDYVQG